MIKKLFIIASSAILSILFLNIKLFAHEVENPKFSTTTFYTYEAGEVTVYEEDLEGKYFESSQEVIDYFYEVGYDRKDTYTFFSYKLTKSEIKLFISHPSEIFKIYKCKKSATNKTIEIFGADSDDTEGNAFKHAYWTMLLSYEVGIDLAYKLVVAHEDYESNPKMSKEMDLYNDEVARMFCLNNEKDDSWIDGSAALSLWTNSELKYIMKDYEYLTKIITNTKTHKVTYEYAKDDFFAYTNTSSPLNVPGYEIEYVGNKNNPSIISEV